MLEGLCVNAARKACAHTHTCTCTQSDSSGAHRHVREKPTCGASLWDSEVGMSVVTNHNPSLEVSGIDEKLERQN